MKRIVIISDCVDIAFNELRATIISSLKVKAEIEPLVPVAPFSILNGCFSLRLIAESYPENTIFSVVLNPLKIRPERIFGRTKKKNFIFIGANTGVFDWFLKGFGIQELYELNDPGFAPFGGKFIHAPAVAQLANNKPFKSLGTVFNHSKLASVNTPKGSVVHIDNFGLIKFTGVINEFKEGQKVSIKVNNKIIEAVFSTRMMSRKTGEWVLYPGSSLGLPEIGKVRENGANQHKIKIGDIIKIL